MPGKRNIRLPRPSGVALWAPIAGLLSLGFLTTLIDFYQLPDVEISRANEASQRFVIDTATGEISLGKTQTTVENNEAPEQFDMASPEEVAEPDEDTDHKPTEAPAEEHKAEPTPGHDAAATEAAKPEDPHAAEAPKPTEVKPETATSEAPKTTEARPEAPKEEAKPVETPMPKDMPTLRTEPLTVDLTAPAHTKDSLVIAPAPEITETVDGLKLPKRGDKDVIPSKLYAQPFTRKPDQVLLSFVVIDVGVDPQSIGLTMGLPKEISVAYSPYVHKDKNYSEHLRALGHEVWTMLPTMTDNYPNDDPGPLGLIAKMPDEEMVRRVREMMAVIPGSIGFVLAPDEAITAKRNELADVLAEIDKRGLLLLSTHANRSIDQITSDKTLHPAIHRADLVLDTEPNETLIRSKLAGIVAAATEKGEYLIVLSARPQSLQLLSEWLKATKLAEPMMLAPLSAMYQPKEAVEPKEEASGGHGGGHGGAEKKKEKPKADKKKQKPLPQDKYLKPAGDKGGGGHGGGGH